MQYQPIRIAGPKALQGLLYDLRGMALHPQGDERDTEREARRRSLKRTARERRKRRERVERLEAW